MTFSIPICFNPRHGGVTRDDPWNLDDLTESTSVSKMIRALLRSLDLHPNDWPLYVLSRCDCGHLETIGKEELIDDGNRAQLMNFEAGDGLFLRKKGTLGRGQQQAEAGEKGQAQVGFSRSLRKRETSESAPALSTPSSSSSSKRSRQSSSSEDQSMAVVTDSSSLYVVDLISKLLGGDGWRRQSIGELGPIQSKSAPALRALRNLVKVSLQLPRTSNRNGLLSRDLVEALLRAHQRPGRSRHYHLVEPDYVHAREFLEGKMRKDGSWQGVAADNVELRTPEERFPLERIGFARKQLTAVRSICCLWLNDAWLTQSPLPGLSPVSCKSQRQTTFLLQIANITPVKPGSTPPNGFPPIVLRALRAAIEQCREDLSIRRSPLGWPQGRALSLTLEILKEELGA